MFVLPLAHSSLRPHHAAFRRLDNAPSLAQVIDRLFDDVQPPAPAAATRTPALDVDETNTHYLLKFDLPGASKDQLKVSIEGRRVRIETLVVDLAAATEAGAETTATDIVAQVDPKAPDAAKTPAPAVAPATPADTPRSLYRERSNVRYARTVSLPQEVDSDASEAKLENGVLILRLAKRRADGARRLAVN